MTDKPTKQTKRDVLVHIVGIMVVIGAYLALVGLGSAIQWLTNQ